MKEYQSFAALIYVTEPEHEAVMRMYDWQALRLPGDAQVYYRAAQTKNGLPIVAAQQDELGMTASATLTMKMIQHFKPKYVIMPGTAAGMPNIHQEGDQEFGDVLIADMVWNYSNGKYVSKDDAPIVFGELGFLPRPTVVKIDESLLPYFQKAFYSEKNEAYIHVGPIASGTSVVANHHVSEGVVKKVFPVTQGLEMESYGVAYAAAHAVEPRPKAIIAKSICDFADERKTDKYQRFAAYTSCEFVKLMIDEILD